MKKSIPNKLIAIFVILGTLIIGTLGYVYIRNIEGISDTNQIIELTKKYILFSLMTFISLTIISGCIFKRIVKKSIIDIK